MPSFGFIVHGRWLGSPDPEGDAPKGFYAYRAVRAANMAAAESRVLGRVRFEKGPMYALTIEESGPSSILKVWRRSNDRGVTEYK